MSTRPSVWDRDPGSQAGEAAVAELPATRLLSAAGLDRLYRSQAGRLVRYFARSLGGEDAKDLVHDAFVRLAAAPVRDDAIRSPEAFVTTVATNALRDRARAAARRALQDQYPAVETGDLAPDPHRVCESREALRTVEAAMARMPPRRRRIILLHRIEQMTYAEIGEAVGMSEKGVKKQVAKSLFELRLALERAG